MMAAVTGGGKDACFTNTCTEPLKPSEDTVVPDQKDNRPVPSHTDNTPSDHSSKTDTDTVVKPAEEKKETSYIANNPLPEKNMVNENNGNTEKKLTAASAVDTGAESNTSLYVTLIVISAAAVDVITVLKSRSKKAD